MFLEILEKEHNETIAINIDDYVISGINTKTYRMAVFTHISGKPVFETNERYCDILEEFGLCKDKRSDMLSDLRDAINNGDDIYYQ